MSMSPCVPFERTTPVSGQGGKGGNPLGFQGGRTVAGAKKQGSKGVEETFVIASFEKPGLGTL